MTLHPPPSGSDPAQEADTVVGLVLGCPAVAELSLGGPRNVATYLPGRIVPGVRVRDDDVTVSVVLALSATVAELDRQVRSALAPVVGHRRLHVHVSDAAVPVVDLPAPVPAPVIEVGGRP